MTLRSGAAVFGVALGLCFGAAKAQPAFQWQTVGAPGNRPATTQEAPLLAGLNVGAVGYAYNISRTEVTVAQWLPFVQAYAPYWAAGGGAPGDIHFTSWWIRPNGSGYGIVPGAENYPADMSWHVAARYCNWLHNGRASSQAAFESGAYDTSTFVLNPDGSRSDQATRSPGAQYWIPSMHEAVKAAYYDPNRYGPGVEGYWLYPNGTNVSLTPGLPGEGGQTSAGIDGLYGFPVGSYPAVQTPWGLLDMSGGRREWTEGMMDPVSRRRYAFGSETGDMDWRLFDRVDFPTGGPPAASGYGLRIATSVPTPGTLWVVGAAFMLHRKPARR